MKHGLSLIDSGVFCAFRSGPIPKDSFYPRSIRAYPWRFLSNRNTEVIFEPFLIGQRHLARGKDPNGLVPLVNQIRGLNGRRPAPQPSLRLLAPARPPEAAGRGQAGAEG